MTGIIILSVLIGISIVAVITIPVETFQEWNNPGSWISYPKVAVPIWVNYLTTEKIPEHKIFDSPNIQTKSKGEIQLTSHQFGVNFEYDDFPNDFIYVFSSEYSDTPLLQMSVIRPDGIKLELISMSLPYASSKVIHSERVFSTDDSIKKNLALQSEKFLFYRGAAKLKPVVNIVVNNNNFTIQNTGDETLHYLYLTHPDHLLY